MSFFSVFLGFLSLTSYYFPMFCLVSKKCIWTVHQGPDILFMGLGMWLYSVGIFLMFGSDCQKHYTLLYRKPRSLITDGFFTYTRNPNYLGEVFIYTAYAIWSRCIMVYVIFL